MNYQTRENWLEYNQRYLMAGVADVRVLLEQHVGKSQDERVNDQQATALDDQQNTDQGISPPSALETICQVFGLSSFERTILLLCAGAELDSGVATLVAAAQNDARQTAPAFDLAMSVFPGAHWSALAPTAPLRHWRLIEVESGNRLTHSPLQIDERILHYLTGISYLDSRLRGTIKPVQQAQELIDSHRRLSEQMAKLWLESGHTSPKPIIQLSGEQYSSKQSIATNACAAIGLQLHAIHCGDIPANPTEREALSRLWEREAVLSESALLVDCETDDNQRAVSAFLQNTHGIIIVGTREPHALRGRPTVTFEVPKPSTREQLDLWHQVLGPQAEKLNGQLEHLAWQFQMDGQTVNAATAQLLDTDALLEPDAFGAKLWDACRLQARQRLDELAQRIDSLARWGDLVLPRAQINTLREKWTPIFGQVC